MRRGVYQFDRLPVSCFVGLLGVLYGLSVVYAAAVPVGMPLVIAHAVKLRRQRHVGVDHSDIVVVCGDVCLLPYVL